MPGRHRTFPADLPWLVEADPGEGGHLFLHVGLSPDPAATPEK